MGQGDKSEQPAAGADNDEFGGAQQAGAGQRPGQQRGGPQPQGVAGVLVGYWEWVKKDHAGLLKTVDEEIRAEKDR